MMPEVSGIVAMGNDFVCNTAHDQLGKVVEFGEWPLMGIQIVHGPDDSISQTLGIVEIFCKFVQASYSSFKVIGPVEMVEPVDVQGIEIFSLRLQPFFLKIIVPEFQMDILLLQGLGK